MSSAKGRTLHCNAGDHEWVMVGRGRPPLTCPEHRPYRAPGPKKSKTVCTCNPYYFHEFGCPKQFLALPGLIGKTDIRLRPEEKYKKEK